MKYWYVFSTDVTKGKGQTSGKNKSSKDDRLQQQTLPSSSGDYKMPLVWIDLEMTGMNLNYYSFEVNALNIWQKLG